MDKLYLIPDPARAEESLALAGEYGAGFEYNDFFYPSLLDDGEALRARIAFWRGFGRLARRDTMHGVFFDVTIHSDDGQIRRVSEGRVLKSVEIAQEMELRGVVFHTNLIPNFKSAFYLDNWLEKNAVFFTRICAENPELEIWMENMFDTEPDMIAALARRMADVKNFGVCYDRAHAQVFGGGPAGWLEALAPYIRHMHINDNDGLTDCHDPVGSGIIDWRAFDDALRARGVGASVLVETTDLGKQRASLEYMKANGIYPFTAGR